MIIKRSTSEVDRHKRKARGIARAELTLVELLKIQANNSVDDGTILELYRLCKGPTE